MLGDLRIPSIMNVMGCNSFEEFLESWGLTHSELYKLSTLRGRNILIKAARSDNSSYINFSELFIFSSNTKFDPHTTWFKLSSEWFAVTKNSQTFPFHSKNTDNGKLFKKWNNNKFDEELL